MGSKPRNKGGRRAYLRKFSSGYINAPRTSNQKVLREYQDRVDGIGQQAPAPCGPVLRHWLDHPEKPNAPGLIFNVRQMARLRQGDFHQYVQKFNYVLLRDCKRDKVYLFFEGTEYYLVREDKILKEVTRSTMYSCRQHAMMALESTRGPIWVEIEPLHSAAKLEEVM